MQEIDAMIVNVQRDEIEHVPELFSVTDFLEAFGAVVESLVQQLRGRQSELPVAKRFGEDAHHLGDWAAFQSRLVAVQGRTGDEDGDCDQHCPSGGPEPPAATQLDLDIDEHCDGQNRPKLDRHEEPVEIAGLELALARVGLVELVGSEGRHARLDAARAECHHVEPRV